MYALIDPEPFHLNIKPKTDVADVPPHFMADRVTPLPYSWEEILTITTEFTLGKNYRDTGLNIFRAVFDTQDNHVASAYKAAPPSLPNTIGWNSTMSPNDIFDQLMTTYGKPTPDTICQNNLAHCRLQPKGPC
jgi:hypothetical protein